MSNLRVNILDKIIDRLLDEEVNSESSSIYANYLNKIAIVRTFAAGVFFAKIIQIEKAGYIGHANAILSKCRRIWKWSGATELSDLAENGVKNKSESKLSVPTDNHLVLGVVEILICSKKCINNINSIPNWSENE
jgi:hypothetical protein